MKTTQKLVWWSAVLGIALVTIALPTRSAAQDQQDQDDPPGRVARLGYLQGSVSFLPAGETDWVGAVPNRPMSTGDQLWTDENSRAEVQLGSAVIRLAPLTTFSFLNLDDDTVQMQLSSGAINVTVRWLGNEEDFEVDTPNQAFNVFQPGHYRVEASADGNYTIISVRAGDGAATGGGQTFTLRGGQRATLSGTDSLYADVEPIYDPDDLDDYGDWRDDPSYGHVWFPNQVAVGWAPYHAGHWAWISPWGWTWVDDSSWGYAPFHYGRWVSVGGRWGWVAGPVTVQAVYAPALVVFIGGGPGGIGGNVGWFPLGPREVYVPSYHVSQAYVTRVNISSTTVNVTQVTNVYNTTIIKNSTTITNITYANRSVQGAVMVVPQQAFVSAQPVAKASVAVNAQQIATMSVSARASVAPTQASVLGARAATAGRVAAPPAAIASRQVVAKKTPPPPPVPFAKQQQALAAHPGQPLARSEVQTLRPAASAAARPAVKVAPVGKPATPNVGHPAANVPSAARPGQPAAPANQPVNRPGTTPTPAERPAAAAPAQPSRPAPQPSQPVPAQPNNRPAATQPSSRPEPVQPSNRPEPTRPEATQPAPNRTPSPSAPAARPQTAAPAERPEQRTSPPAAAKPAMPAPTKPAAPPTAAKPAPAQKPPAKPLTPEEKKQQEEREKKEQQKPQSE